MRISAVETRTLPVSRSTRRSPPPGIPPRATHQEATLVVVHDRGGRSAGYASGDDGLPDRALLERLLVGVDPLRGELVRELCETVDFHGGRPWAVEVAAWDAAARGARAAAVAAPGRPATSGSSPTRRRASGWIRRSGRAAAWRFATTACARSSSASAHADWRDDVAVVGRVRDAVGDGMTIMVDANQGWRMPGDRAPRWDVPRAAAVARALEPLGVHWLEEPLPTWDVAGYAALRAATSLRIAAGEMVRGAHEARDLLLRGGIDVLQSDVLVLRRDRRLPPPGGAGGAVRPRLVAAHVVERLRPAGEPARGARVLRHTPTWRCRSTRRRGRPSGATGCSRRRSRSPATARSRRRTGPASGVEPDLDALERWRVG